MSAARELSQRAGWAGRQPISDLMSRALANPGLISLAAGFVDQQSLPVEPTNLALAALLADADRARAALQYGTTPGYPPLRDILLRRFLERDCRGVRCDVAFDQVVITAGSNQLLHLVSECLLDPGDVVLCAAPTYLVYLGTLANLGARSVGVATDRLGIIPEALNKTLADFESAGELDRVKAIYLVPYSDNPCGITMPLERRAAVVDIARRWSRRQRIHVVADEAYRELRYWGDDVLSMRAVDERGDTVVVAGTFSKSFSPGIRVGWGILPRHLVDPVCAQKGNIDFGSPNFNQHLLTKVLELGLFDAHVARIRESYRAKLVAMLNAAGEFLSPLRGVEWIRPAGGLYVWVKLPAGIDTGPQGPLFDLAVRAGVLYVPGEYCYPAEGEPAEHNTMRLSFGVQPVEKIREGIGCLARAIARCAAT